LIIIRPCFPGAEVHAANCLEFRTAGCRSAAQKSTARGGGQDNAIMQKPGFSAGRTIRHKPGISENTRQPDMLRTCQNRRFDP
jgi:hypothetical protein